MTRLITILAVLMHLLLLAGPLAAQAPAWQAVQALATSSTGSLGIKATATDASGNVYLTGSFYNTVQAGAITLTSAGGDDLFVAKYNIASRSLVWVVRAGGTSSDFTQGIAVSGNSVYVAGTFLSSTATFGTTTLTKTSGSGNGFLAKLTDTGSTASFTWVRQVGGPGFDWCVGVAAVGSTVYLGGHFSSPTLPFGTTTLTSAGNYDVYVARLTDAGSSSSYDWAVRAGGGDSDFFNNMTLVGRTLYLSGSFKNTATLGATTLTGPATANSGFLAKLTDAGSTGSFGWALAPGSSGDMVLRSVTAVGTTVYVAGEFYGATASFGATTLLNSSTAGSQDLLVAKLTDAGSTASWVWAQRAGGAGSEYSGAVLARGSNVYLSGSYTGTDATFGATTLSNAGAVGTGDVFVARLADAGGTGSFVWAQKAGGTDYDISEALSSSGTDLLVWGAATLPATFGSQALSGTAGNTAAFLATLPDATGLAAGTPAPLSGLVIYPNPAPGAATVRVPAGAGAATVQVLDALGRVLRRATVATGQDYALALIGLAPGVYAVRVQVGEATATQRLAVE